jgi:hypothetical protein
MVDEGAQNRQVAADGGRLPAERHADEGPVLGVAESLVLVEQERTHARRRLGTEPVSICLVWGVAWFVGFGVTWLAVRTGEVLPGWLGAAAPAVLIVAAVAVSLRQLLIAGRGVRGRSRRVAAMYGWSWLLGFVCLNAVNLRVIGYGLSAHGAALLWSGSALALVGLLYLAGGAIWNDLGQFGMGVWMLVCAAGAVLAGVPANFAVLALAGGGGFFAMAGYLARKQRAAEAR